MEVTKFETNYRRKLFFNKTKNINFKTDIKNEENTLINIYPDISFQKFIGFGRSFNSVLHAIIYLHVLKKLRKIF